MRRIKIAGAALLMAAMFGAVGSGSASAKSFCGPSETGEGNYTTATCGGTATALSNYILGEATQIIPNGLVCVKTNAAHALLRYTNSACTMASTPVDTGTFGRVEGTDGIVIRQNVAFPAKFKDTAVGSTVFKTPGGAEIKCTEGAGEGELASGSEGTMKITFKGCTSALGSECKSVGGMVGSITFSEKMKVINWEKKAEEFKRAELMEVEGTNEIECAGVKIDIKGSVSGLSEKELEWASTLPLLFKEVEGAQEIHDSNKLEAKVGEGAFESVTQSGTIDLEDFKLENEEVIML